MNNCDKILFKNKDFVKHANQLSNVFERELKKQCPNMPASRCVTQKKIFKRTYEQTIRSVCLTDQGIFKKNMTVKKFNKAIKKKAPILIRKIKQDILVMKKLGYLCPDSKKKTQKKTRDKKKRKMKGGGNYYKVNLSDPNADVIVKVMQRFFQQKNGETNLGIEDLKKKLRNPLEPQDIQSIFDLEDDHITSQLQAGSVIDDKMKQEIFEHREIIAEKLNLPKEDKNKFKNRLNNIISQMNPTQENAHKSSSAAGTNLQPQRLFE